MTSARRTAAAAATAALACALWLALGSADRDIDTGVAIRVAVVDGAEEKAPSAADLFAVRSKERRRAVAAATLDAATIDAASTQEPQGLPVTGRVRADTTFSPEAVTTIWAHRPGVVEDKARSVKAAPSTSRAWNFESLPPGSWVFTAFVVEGERAALGSVGPVDVLKGMAPVSIEAVEYSVGGVVTDSGGQPLAGIPVNLTWASTQQHRLPSRHFPPSLGGGEDLAQFFGGLSSNLPHVNDAQQRTTDILGRFSFAVAGPGTVELRAPGSTIIGREAITFGQPKGGRVEGSVQIGPDHQMLVSFEMGSPTALQPARLMTSEEAVVISEELSTSVLGLAADGAGDDGTWLASRVEVQLTPAKPRVDDLVLQLHQTAKLKGRLRADAGGPEGIDCFLRLLSEGAPKGAARQQHVSTDENGEFTFERCAPGEYFLYARSGGADGQDYSLRVTLTLEEGEERFLNDRLTPSARINGVVHDREGTPLVGVDVLATGCRNGNLTRRATTDASGMYTLKGLYEGEYELKLANNSVEERLIIKVPEGGAAIEAATLVASDI